METVIAIIGGVLIGQLGTFISHFLSLHRDQQQARIKQEASRLQWEREEKSKEIERKHNQTIRLQDQAREAQKQVRTASEDLLSIAHRTLHVQSEWPKQNDIQEALSKVRALTGARSQVSILSYVLADSVSSMLARGISSGDPFSAQAQNQGIADAIDRNIERLQIAIDEMSN